MLVVSNIDLKTTTPLMKPTEFLKASVKDFTLNLNNDYRYLKTGYYVSMHAEILGNTVIPTSKNIIDAYRTPVLLLKAQKAGIPTMRYLVTSSIKQMIDEIGFPLVVFAVNPVSFHGYKIAKNKTALYRTVKSLTMNYKFAVCAQPLKGEMVTVKSIFGECQQSGSLREIARKIYAVFNIPICRLYAQYIEEEAYLCGLQPLKKEELLSTDLDDISRVVSRLYENGD